MVEKFGSIDIFVNNVGIVVNVLIEDVKFEDFE